MTNSTASHHRSRPPSSAPQVGEALLRLGMRLYRLEVEALESVSVPLSVRQYRILDRVDREITSMTELAALARRQLPTISRSVDSLVRQGLLARHPSPTDRRVAALELTPEGTKILEEARTALQLLATWVGEAFGIDLEAGRLAEAVDALYAASQGDPHPGPGPVRTGRAVRSR